jgi:hypothetical protein
VHALILVPKANAVCTQRIGAGERKLALVVSVLILAAVGSSCPPEEGVSDWVPQEPEFRGIAQRLKDSSNRYFGTRQVHELRQRLKQTSRLPPARVARLHLQLWWHLLRLGDTEAAIEQIDAAISLSEYLPGDTAVHLYSMRALTYLRQAEVANCIERHNPDCCILPLERGGVHSVKTPAEHARRDYLAHLETRPGDLEAQWLLNVASMALADYPDGVPERYRIPPEAFASEYDIGRFVDVAPVLGLDTFNLCGGAIVEDFDNNGFLDIVTSTFDPEGPLTFYRSLPDGRFEDASSSSRLADQLGGLNCNAADYDNDGDVDILVLRGAWLFADGRIRNSLLDNDGEGTFTDVTRTAGLGAPYPTQAAAWGDFDNDGRLDLYVCNESLHEQLGPGQRDLPSQLFRNNGDGTFVDVAPRAGVTNDRLCKGVAAGDYDNDGDLDLYLSNMGKNRLYRNEGDGTFTDMAEQLGVTAPERRSFATWFFDYDNDGDLDLFVGAYDATTSDVAADFLGRPHKATSPCLYRNEGDGRFANVTERLGLDHPYLPMGANFGDVDNDGFLDVYLATGDPNFQSLMPNVMLRNDGGRRFQNVTTSGGFGHLQKGHGVAFADIDNDGDQDIYHQLGGFFPSDRFQNALFVNPGHDHHYLVVKLIGTASNRSGFGARIKVVVRGLGGTTSFHRAVGSVSSFGGSPLRQEIGLGDAEAIERVEIFWPVSETLQVLTDVPTDAMIRVTEGSPGFERVDLQRRELAGS